MLSGINSTSSVSQTSSQEYAAAQASSSNSTGTTQTDPLAQQQTFLKLLVAQMQTQDPMNPMDGTTFMNQLTQLSELEQLTSINGGIQSLLQMASTPSSTSTDKP